MAAITEAVVASQVAPRRSIRRRVSPLGFGAAGLLLLIVVTVALGPRLWNMDPLE